MIQTIVLKIDKTKFQCEIIDNQTFYIRRLRRNGSWTFGFSPSEINGGVWMPELAGKSFMGKQMDAELKRYKNKYLAVLEKLKTLSVYF